MKVNELPHNLLLQLPAEPAHNIGKWAIKRKLLAPGKFRTKESRFELFDFELDNPLGLAAGFDKNGELVNSIRDYGFSYVEIGSLTYLGSKGNKKPRLFRIEKESLLNRMGLNGDPAETVVARLRKTTAPFAVNIAKTNDDKITGDKAIEDIVNTYRLAKDLGIYTVLNISCPNTEDGRTFEDPRCLDELLCGILETGKGRPLLLKLSPGQSRQAIHEIIEFAHDRVDGYVCGNTAPHHHPTHGTGGGSGKIVRRYSLNLIKNVRNLTKKPVIGVGGIYTGADAEETVEKGANAGFQAFNGFILGPNKGPRFAHKVLNEYYLKKTFYQKSDNSYNTK